MFTAFLLQKREEGMRFQRWHKKSEWLRLLGFLSEKKSKDLAKVFEGSPVEDSRDRGTFSPLCRKHGVAVDSCSVSKTMRIAYTVWNVNDCSSALLSPLFLTRLFFACSFHHPASYLHSFLKRIIIRSCLCKGAWLSSTSWRSSWAGFVTHRIDPTGSK